MIAADGEKLLAAVDAATDQPVAGASPGGGNPAPGLGRAVHGRPWPVALREVKDMPSPAELITSPYDTDARYSTKRDMEWVGYKVHLTETCDRGNASSDRQR